MLRVFGGQALRVVRGLLVALMLLGEDMADVRQAPTAIHSFAESLVLPLKLALDTRGPTAVAVALQLMGAALALDPGVAGRWVPAYWQFAQEAQQAAMARGGGTAGKGGGGGGGGGLPAMRLNRQMSDQCSGTTAAAPVGGDAAAAAAMATAVAVAAAVEQSAAAAGGGAGRVGGGVAGAPNAVPSGHSVYGGFSAASASVAAAAVAAAAAAAAAGGGRDGSAQGNLYPYPYPHPSNHPLAPSHDGSDSPFTGGGVSMSGGSGLSGAPHNLFSSTAGYTGAANLTAGMGGTPPTGTAPGTDRWVERGSGGERASLGDDSNGAGHAGEPPERHTAPPGPSAAATPLAAAASPFADATAAAVQAQRRESAPLIREAFTRELQRFLTTSRRVVAAAGAAATAGRSSPSNPNRRNLLVATPRTLRPQQSANAAAGLGAALGANSPAASPRAPFPLAAPPAAAGEGGSGAAGGGTAPLRFIRGRGSAKY
ncbi:hypothetical protein HYH03_014496 [Edaphochlamys debaryana]|uniref:Uncharacterized protein n=1 Tax=Edaphochlamys debaryana TaxID=47281 RepID=A0A835XMI1_9CHLO|nr:hypothetical protein HYH03_014496 [Edaphochlamys debaryana]|eukprot:KAG2486813.1 hypothetical protein HYH03_014496 [Edaphochlamys debaryana]